MIKKKELNYKLVLRVYNAGLNFKNNSYKLDWILKDKFILIQILAVKLY